MHNILDNTKSTLGKLLAAENIRIEHRQVKTPSFDVMDRILVLPIWKDIDSDLYDLMIGHEVGHALYTPANGWIKGVKELGAKFRGIINIVEDARIEKLMKKKFPGLRKPMYFGYTQLVSRGFFGVELDDMKHLPIADRVNVYFKLGTRANVSFNDIEQNLVTKIEQCETWDEVMILSKELMHLAKNELDALPEEISKYFNDAEDASDNTVQVDIDHLRENGNNQDADKLEYMSKNEKFRDKMKEWEGNSEPESITDKAMTEHQPLLVDATANAIAYTFFPEINHKDFIIPAKIVHDLMCSEFQELNDNNQETETENALYHTFMETNRNYIGHLVKEFELKRNAKQYARARVNKTGKLNPDKIWEYKLSENLFLQNTLVPNGKNHGMIMLVDMSGSMESIMSGTIEQIINLSMFCRKVNIPFDVYGFIDNASAEKEYIQAGIFCDKYQQERYLYSFDKNDTRAKTLQITKINFRLKQLLHYKMGAAEFTSSVKNLLNLSNGFQQSTKNYSIYSQHRFIPKSMQLNGTPLNEAVMVLRSLAKEFKKNTQIEILNTVLLTDGDSSYKATYFENKNQFPSKVSWNYHHTIEDRKTKIQVNEMNCGGNTTLALLEIYKQTTGSRVIGIYLMARCRWSYKRQILDTLVKSKKHEANNYNFNNQYDREFVKHKYFGMKIPGYDFYYMVPGEGLEIEKVSMDSVLGQSSQKKTSLLKAFTKMQNKKNISRVFLNKFIEQVS